MSNNVSNLAKLKLEVIKYHTNQNGESNKSMVNQYFLESIAKDSCYTSLSSINFKNTQIADAGVEYDTKKKEHNYIACERIDQYVQRLTLELSELQIRHDADCQVYTVVTGGQAYQYKPKKLKTAPKESEAIKAARKMAAERKAAAEVGA